MSYLHSIILSENADRVETFAAGELAKYVCAITNQQISIVTNGQNIAEGTIYVGRLSNGFDEFTKHQISADLKELHDDGFVIRNIGDNLAIYGKTSRATLYGVYHYLNLLGVRWYFPGRENEFLPTQPQIEIVPLNIIESPDIGKRGVVIHPHNSALHEWIDFAPKVKINTIAMHSDLDIHKMPELFADRGLSLDLEQHLFGGEFCFTNPTEWERNKTLARDFVRQLPGCIRDFFLWQADVWLEQTEYAKKRNYNLSDSTLQFMNEMLSAIKEVRPDARLAFLAYLSTWERPKHVQPADGIFLEIAPIHRCFAHAITDPHCPINSPAAPNVQTARQLVGVKSVIEELLQVFNPGETQVLGYWLDASLFGRSRYKDLHGRVPQFGDVIKNDVNYYRSLGISAITTFAAGINKEYLERFTSPTIFQYANVLWDNQADLHATLVDFCEHFYGEKELAKVFQLSERLDPIDSMPQHWEAYREELSDAKERVQQILNGTTDETIRIRLERLRDEITFLRNWLQD